MALKLARWFLAAVFVFEVYRAATQSFTVDEAFLYLHWIKPGFREILSVYDAGHHVLYTWLAWLVSKPLGYSELVLRLPSLAGCAAYLLFAYRFANRLESGPWFRFAAIVLLSSNPLILDHLAIARGYGLALALFAWSIDSLMRDRLTTAGVLAGLSVAANLTFLFPVAAMVIAVIILRPSVTLIDQFIGPGVVIAFVLLIVPLTHANHANYYYGATSLRDSLWELVNPNFARTFESVGLATGYTVLVVGAAGLIAGLVTRAAALPTRLLSITTLVAIGFTLGSHWLLKLPLPQGRTGLWLIFLLLLAAIEGASRVPAPQAVAAILLVLGLAQCIQLDPRYFKEWQFDASTKRLMKKIRDREAPMHRAYTIMATSNLKWSVEYYRQRLKLKDLQPLKEAPPADYVYIFSQNAGKIPGYTAIMQDPLCACEFGQIR